ncbi:heterokaryon incompatibility protein-domain-containing protein [Dendryphion nanum]|uniref:Heterokaryon incompatibility protein-domain-containing protein n=1 Tax=Dendryphion nanum TaxID=256645 RepID=A0A9P9IR52_9PLEO|nr:heterokaryon incompatibility protein-domain-containing protein [Dendryphion nanum]
MTSAPSIYHTLGHQRSIRLLRIHPGKDEKRMVVDLDEFNLDSDVQYTALSYVWGNSSPPSQITCNGHCAPVTRNLWDVLSCLREKNFGSLLWVDAICINQQDRQEKSTQVSMMRDIYKRAAKVVFWLGRQEQYDKNAVELMNIFNARHKFLSDVESLRGKSLNEIGLPLNHHGWIGWASILSRPWFGRVWIVQEFLNATQSVFMSGALEIPSNLLIWFAYAAGAAASMGSAIALCSAQIFSNRRFALRLFGLGLDLYIRATTEDPDTRIVDLWTRSQLLEATDPRDRVFALLSTQTAVNMDIVDYNKDVVSVYKEIARIALFLPVPRTYWYSTTPKVPKHGPATDTMERTSRFLACKTASLHSPTLPSWVPDWRPVDFLFVPLTRFFPGTAWFTHKYSHAIVDGPTLTISGYVQDRPKIIVESTPYPRLGDSDNSKAQLRPKRILNWQIMCYLLAKGYCPHLNGNKFLEAFCRAMAFNALPNRVAAPGAQYIEGFRALHENLGNSPTEEVNCRLNLPRSRNAVEHDVVYESVVTELAAGRKFAITRGGDMAWVPTTTTLNDRICFLAGCAVPFVIRPRGKSFDLLGDCYLHSMMTNDSIVLNSQPQLLEFR